MKCIFYEKEKLVKFAIEKIRDRIPLILNIAEGSTREAIRQAALAKAWGAYA
ncbi:dihydrodipicolinate synthase family protein [Agriterribacter sp.]|uniref:dihydrodipicolinate synthase family protein n=1 Tax=Agriterribacter sp. TaxID=2821509 RepID=UPI002D1FA86B|nr:dihydrodipicolinate synthase family protein [Agriterribacter sp.]